MVRNRSTNKAKPAMSLVHPNAAAIDIGATMHMAAVSADRTPEPVRSFGTFTADLHRLVDWFTECGVETVVMESTGVYWIPIFELLDTRGFAVFVVNARDAKHVPGRKTDVSDAQWLQRLHSYGLLSTSFRPKGRIAELRSYVRQRERLLEYAASHIQHMQKALMEMNLQVHHVVADISDLIRQRLTLRRRNWCAVSIFYLRPEERLASRSIGTIIVSLPLTCPVNHYNNNGMNPCHQDTVLRTIHPDFFLACDIVITGRTVAGTAILIAQARAGGDAAIMTSVFDSAFCIWIVPPTPPTIKSYPSPR